MQNFYFSPEFSWPQYRVFDHFFPTLNYFKLCLEHLHWRWKYFKVSSTSTLDKVIWSTTTTPSVDSLFSIKVPIYFYIYHTNIVLILTFSRIFFRNRRFVETPGVAKTKHIEFVVEFGIAGVAGGCTLFQVQFSNFFGSHFDRQNLTVQAGARAELFYYF